jgi:hypothetical protein
VYYIIYSLTLTSKILKRILIEESRTKIIRLKNRLEGIIGKESKVIISRIERKQSEGQEGYNCFSYIGRL